MKTSAIWLKVQTDRQETQRFFWAAGNSEFHRRVTSDIIKIEGDGCHFYFYLFFNELTKWRKGEREELKLVSTSLAPVLFVNHFGSLFWWRSNVCTRSLSLTTYVLQPSPPFRQERKGNILDSGDDYGLIVMGTRQKTVVIIFHQNKSGGSRVFLGFFF